MVFEKIKVQKENEVMFKNCSRLNIIKIFRTSVRFIIVWPELVTTHASKAGL